MRKEEEQQKKKKENRRMFTLSHLELLAKSLRSAMTDRLPTPVVPGRDPGRDLERVLGRELGRDMESAIADIADSALSCFTPAASFFLSPSRATVSKHKKEREGKERVRASSTESFDIKI